WSVLGSRRSDVDLRPPIHERPLDDVIQRLSGETNDIPRRLRSHDDRRTSRRRDFLQRASRRVGVVQPLAVRRPGHAETWRGKAAKIAAVGIDEPYAEVEPGPPL